MHEFTRPRVEDYGSLRDVTRDASLLMPGLAAATNQMSTPLGPGAAGVQGNQTISGAPDSNGVLGTTSHGTSGHSGHGTGSDPGSGGGVLGTSGSGGDPTGSTGHTADVSVDPSGAGGGKLPFTGFAAAGVASVGAAMVATGAAVRRALRTDKP